MTNRRAAEQADELLASRGGSPEFEDALRLRAASLGIKAAQAELRGIQVFGNGGSYEVLFKTLQALGVRYVIGHERLPAADDHHFSRTMLPRRLGTIQVGGWEIYELPEPNLGNYSPTEPIRKEAAEETVAVISASSFDFRRQVVLPSATTPLVPARHMQLTVIRGGLHVTGRSDGTSLALLPLQFSHCLRARDLRVRLVRANLMMTAVMFTGDINTDIAFDYGIFSPGCRHADLADMNRFGLVQAFFNQFKSIN